MELPGDWTCRRGEEVAVRLTEPAENTPATGEPTISGTPQVGETLTADTSPIDDRDGLTNVSYRYQWVAGGTDIDGATGSSYLLTSSEQGETIQARVSFIDDRNNAEARTSDATGAVIAAPNRQATGKPTIDGTARVGQTLTADTSNISDLDGITNATFFYQWRAEGLNHNRGQPLHLHPHRQRAGQDRHGKGEIRRRPAQHRIAGQRCDRRGGGGTQP